MDRNELSGEKSTGRIAKRRDFIKASAAAGAASIVTGAASSVHAASPTKNRKLRIGAIAVGEYSFYPYSWGDILSPFGTPFNQGTLETDILNMEITQVWDVNHEAAQQFAAQIGAQAVKNYDDMVGLVDGVAFGGYFEVPWQNKLARPYIEAGIPTYLSRPFAYSLRDIDEILDLAAKHNTPILATDLYEHIYGTRLLKSNLKNVGEIECVHGTCLTVDYPALFHTQFMILKIFGFDVRQVSVITDNPLESSYLVGNYLFNGWEGQKPFLCSMTKTSGDLYTFYVTGTEGIETARISQILDRKDDLLTHHIPLLIAMQRTFEGKIYEPFDNIRRKTEIFLTGFYSALERGGAPVDVGIVPPDWRARPAQPDWIDESMFKR
ncbi:Gfo/Idh/MocA family oxidoreductase [Candidatus Latescibacterota bacterium]